MPCSEKGNLTDEAFFFYRKKAGSFSHQKRDRTPSDVIYQEIKQSAEEDKRPARTLLLVHAC
jgi:hypothetical protein